MVYLNSNKLVTKCAGLVACMMLAGCLGSSGGGQTAQDIVDNLPDDVVPIVIENEDEIREIIDTELDDDLRDVADEVIDLIVSVATTTVAVTSVTVSGATN